MKCPKCQHENPPDTTFCGKCATRIRGHVPGTCPPDSGRPNVTETIEPPREELTTGSTFAGRYQVIEELGHGGMGRVYKVHDTKIGEKIALKLIRPEAGLDSRTIERFSNELKLARKIRHKNVCQMFDLGEDRGTRYITMEYVQGEDLRQLLRKVGRMSPGQAMAVARQVCTGLEEAHKLGVVHRDLKPQNIMLDEDGQARIMDFGIARSLMGKSITGAGTFIGTPEYMSPEQVEGKDVDERSDIYSLGVILYEMVAGKRPFDGETALAIAHKHKYEAPEDPRTADPQIPERLAQVILRCLEKDRAARYGSAGALDADLAAIEAGLPTTEKVAAKRKPFTSKEITVKFNLRKALVPAILVLVVIIAAIVFWPKKASDLDPNLVAVAIFENKTGDPRLDPIGSRAAERIMQGLKQVGEFSVAPMPPAEALRAESKSKDRLRALANLTKAGKIVHGDYYLQGETIQFHAWVEDMAAKKNLFALEPASGPMADPDAALEPLRLRLMGGLAGVFDPVLRDSIALLKEPPNFEAFREFMEGIRYFLRGEYSQSIPHFLKAEEFDPRMKVALIYHAHAFLNQGQYAEANEVAQIIEKSRAELSTLERLELDFTLAVLRGDLEAQLRITRQRIASERTPAEIYLHGHTANKTNYPREAVAALSQYDPYSPGRQDWSIRYWEILTWARHMLGDHKRELKEARRGRKQFPENLRMVVNEAEALAALGRTEDLQTLFEESKTLPPTSGYSPGDIMLRAGRVLRAHGSKEDAIRVLNQALGWFESRSEPEKASAGNRYGQAQLLYVLERWDEAGTMFMALHSDMPENVNYLGYLGVAAARKGEKEEALQISKELEKDKRPYLFGNPAYWRARIAALLGDKEAAVNLLRQATKEGYTYYNIHPTEDFESLADYPPYIQLMKPKG